MYELNTLMYAYIRGYIKRNKVEFNDDIINKPLLELSKEEQDNLYQFGKINNLKLHYFKDKDILPRVKLVLGFLKNIYPKTILDIGTGRGVFLFPLLNTFSNIYVTACDILPYRVEFLECLKDGGINELNVISDDISKDINVNITYDCVTLLEVLEHIPQVENAVKNAIALSNKFIVVTVPSKIDDNPEHIHLLTKEKLTKMFNNFGVTNLKFSGVNGHLFMVAVKES